MDQSVPWVYSLWQSPTPSTVRTETLSQAHSSHLPIRQAGPTRIWSGTTPGIEAPSWRALHGHSHP